tara:strand:- start:12136 stop:13395 length:1260 start_codon:yes stop_codon:yes gene_type:complete
MTDETAFGIPRISLRHLKAALFVTRSRNVTRAAKQLNRSQTAITKAINELEHTLDVRLFDRTATGMTPTVYAQTLATRIEMAANEFKQAGESYKRYNPAARHSQSIAVFTMDISYKRLAAVIALQEKRDVGLAADALQVSRAAIYNSVRQLETLLDAPLFQREPHGMSPTPYCKVLARHTQLAFAQIRHALDDVASLDGILQGRVVIGTLPYSRTFITPQAINRLLQEHPQLDVATREGPYAVLESALRCGDIDLIIGAVRAPADGGDITTHVLFEDRLSVIARSQHPLMKRKTIRFRDLQNSQWVLPGADTPARQLFDATLRKHGMQVPQHAVETSSLSMVRGLLVDSDRLALLSEHQIYYDKLYGVLDVLPVKLEETNRPIGVTLRAHTPPSPAARLFLDYLEEVVADRPSGTTTGD